MPTFDLAVIGAGPGGFDAALRARELGFQVALIEKENPGGACLKSGCIPTKSLLASAKFLTRVQNARSFGISVSGVSCDLEALRDRKNRIVEMLRKGMTETLKRSGVEWMAGEASFAGKNRLSIKSGKEIRELEARSVLIAAGSEPVPFPGVPFDGERVLSTDHLLEMNSLPKRLLIIGGGVVGVEFASIFQPLGVRVTIVEMLERLIPGEDEEVARRLDALFRRKGIEISTGEKVKSLTLRTGGVEAVLNPGRRFDVDRVLVAMGRKPRLENLGLEKAGVKIEKGMIVVDEYQETSAPGIFAVGDVTNRTTGLAHGASAEGILVAENLKGKRTKMDCRAIPNCIYTDPEVASVGSYRSVSPRAPEEVVECKILFSSIAKSQVEEETEGFIKMMASKKDGRVLGFTGIGAHVTELIHEAALAIKAGLHVRTLAETVHAHPTESEILQKAAQKLHSMLDTE